MFVYQYPTWGFLLACDDLCRPLRAVWVPYSSCNELPQSQKLKQHGHHLRVPMSRLDSCYRWARVHVSEGLSPWELWRSHHPLFPSSHQLSESLGVAPFLVIKTSNIVSLWPTSNIVSLWPTSNIVSLWPCSLSRHWSSVHSWRRFFHQTSMIRWGSAWITWGALSTYDP